MTAREWQLRLTYMTLPLSLNDRSHWAKTAAVKRQLRDTVRYAALGAKIPRLEKIHVQMHWTPAVKRVRDADNAVATLKPAIDGLRDYRATNRYGRVIHPAWTGIVPDDDPEHVVWSPPIIHPVDRELTERLWLTITDLSEEAK